MVICVMDTSLHFSLQLCQTSSDINDISSFVLYVMVVLVLCVTIVNEIIVIKTFRQRSYLLTFFVREANQPHAVSMAKSLI
jgi:hypothetical protein